MMRSILLRSIFDRRLFIALWSLILLIFPAIHVVVFIKYSDAFERVRGFLPEESGHIIPTGSYSAQLPEFVAGLFLFGLPLLLVIMASILAVKQTVEFELTGKLRTVLAGRYSRTNWYIQTWYSALAILSWLIFVGTIALISTILILGATVPWRLLLTLDLMILAIVMTFYTIVFAIGSLSGSRVVTIILSLIIVIGSFGLTAGSVVGWLEQVSLMHYYNPDNVIDDGVSIIDQLIILLIIGFSFGLGLIGFRRRDIKGRS